MSNTNLTGPFGFWTFPILKIFMDVFSFKFTELPRRRITDKIKNRRGEKASSAKSSNINKSVTTPTATPPVITNTETWSWTDYKGVKQEITVQRQKTIKG